MAEGIGLNQEPRRLVKLLLWASFVPGLVGLVGGLVLIGWLWLRVIDENWAVGLVLFAVWLVLMAVPMYIGMRLGIKHGKRRKKQMEDYRERVRVGRYRD